MINPPEIPGLIDFDNEDYKRTMQMVENYLYSKPLQPFVRQYPKIGRNEQCPCGSGRKFKNCCNG